MKSPPLDTPTHTYTQRKPPSLESICQVLGVNEEYWLTEILCTCQQGGPCQKKKSVPLHSFPKKPAGTPCVQPWLVAVGGWRLAVGGDWWLAVGNWRLVAVGGGWRRLVVGDWWLVAVGGWSPLAVGGWRLVAVGGW